MKKLVALAVTVILLGGALLAGAQAITTTKPRAKWATFPVAADATAVQKVKCVDPDLPNWDRPTLLSGGYTLDSVDDQGHMLEVVQTRPVLKYTTNLAIGWKVAIYNPTQETIWAQVWVICGP